mgnify:FL=1
MKIEIHEMNIFAFFLVPEILKGKEKAKVVLRMREKTNGKTMSKPFHWIKGDPWIPEWRDDMREGTQDKHVTFALDPDQIIPKPRNRHIFPKVKYRFGF